MATERRVNESQRRNEGAVAAARPPIDSAERPRGAHRRELHTGLLRGATPAV